MYEKILEILIKNREKYIGNGFRKSATEISDMFRKFDEWKDYHLSTNSIFLSDGIYSFENYDFAYEHLFDYWYNDIREK